MTLQDFKDQVARDYMFQEDGKPYKDWKHFEYDWQGLARYNRAFDRAAELYAKEREKDAYLTGYSDGKEGHTCLYKK